MGSGILFDFGGTLDADGVPWVDRFFVHYRSLGGRLAAGQFRTVFQASDRTLESVIEPQDGFLETLDKQTRALATLLPDGGLVDRAAWTRHMHLDTLATVGRNAPVLDSLSDRFTLGVVSNFFGNLRAVLDELGLLEFFRCVTDSNVVGIHKPDPRAFQLTCAGVGLPPSECLMVGDNPFADIQGAAAIPMETCWLAPADRETPDGVEPTHRIARFDELLVVLP